MSSFPNHSKDTHDSLHGFQLKDADGYVLLQTALVPSPGVSIASGVTLYQVLESGYNPQTWINGNGGAVSPVTKSSWYGKPFLFQNARSIRFTLRYTF